MHAMYALHPHHRGAPGWMRPPGRVRPTRVLIVYYSRFGALEAMGEQIAAGARSVEPTDVRLLRIGDEPVKQLRPVEDVGAMTLRRAIVAGELAAADALIVGSPAYFGSMASPMKRFFEDCATATNPPIADRSRPWRQYLFRNKVGAAFTASGTSHGGNEQTLHSILTMMMHFGMVIATPGQREPILENLSAPYGPTLVTGPKGTITLVGVADVWNDIPGAYGTAEEETLLRDFLARDLAATGAALRGRGLSVQEEIRRGDAATEILACAAGRGADLIAMTTHGRTGVARWVIGSVATRVLRGGTIPTLVVRPDMVQPGTTTVPIRTVVVPLDGSDRAAQSLVVARRVAEGCNASIEVVRVVDDRWAYPVMTGMELYATTYAPEAMVNLRAEAASDVEATAEHLRRCGLRATGTLLVGDPAEQLVDHLAAQKDALVVISSHGRTGLDRWVFGSVAEKIITHVHTPLLVLRANAHGVVPTLTQTVDAHVISNVREGLPRPLVMTD